MQCPKCGAENKPDASVCSSCYYDLSSTTAPVIPPPVDDTTRVQSPAPVAQPVNAQATVMGGPPPTYQPNTSPGAPGTFPGQGFPMAQQQYVEHIGFWPRVAAYLIDGFLLGAVYFILLLVTGGMAAIMEAIRSSSGGNSEQIMATLMPKLAVVDNLSRLLTIVYFVGMTASRGATFGKMALGIKIVKEDGSPIGIGVAIGRYLLQTIFATLTCGLSYIAVAVSPTYQGWHDKIMGTVVIHNR